MNEPGMTKYGLDQGFVGELPPAPIPGGLGENLPSGGLPTPSATPVAGIEVDPLVQQMVDLLRSVPKIQGRIFIVGEYLSPEYREVTSGSGSAPKVTIGLTDMIDKKTIIDFVKAQAPAVYGNMKFVKVGDPPSEPYIDVSGGSGYDVQGGTLEAAPAAPPAGEDMAALQAALGGEAGAV
jgi:hypothetical protein